VCSSFLVHSIVPPPNYAFELTAGVSLPQCCTAPAGSSSTRRYAPEELHSERRL